MRPGFKKISNGDCGGLRNVPHWLEYLNTWSSAGGTFGGSHGIFTKNGVAEGSTLLGVGFENS